MSKFSSEAVNLFESDPDLFDNSWAARGFAPPYSKFKVDGHDEDKRQYMVLAPTKIGVRLPIKLKGLEFPNIGSTLSIVQVGTGIAVSVYIEDLALPNYPNPKTALLDIKYI